MSFVSRRIKKEEARQLIDKYDLESPGSSNDRFLSSTIIAMSYSKEDDAVCVCVRAQRGFYINGHRTSYCAPQVNTLVWKGYRIRIDLYETIYGDYCSYNGKIDEVILIIKRIMLPVALKSDADKIVHLAAEGSLSLYKALLLPKDVNMKCEVEYDNVEVKVVESEEDIWKQ